MIAASEPNDNGCDDPRLLTAGDLAKRLRVSIRQVYRLDKSGSVPAPLRIGGCTRWRGDEISRWLQCGGPPRVEWEKQRDAELAPTVETS